jgi:hypothetical protein
MTDKDVLKLEKMYESECKGQKDVDQSITAKFEEHLKAVLKYLDLLRT